MLPISSFVEVFLRLWHSVSSCIVTWIKCLPSIVVSPRSKHFESSYQRHFNILELVTKSQESRFPLRRLIIFHSLDTWYCLISWIFARLHSSMRTIQPAWLRILGSAAYIWMIPEWQITLRLVFVLSSTPIAVTIRTIKLKDGRLRGDWQDEWLEWRLQWNIVGDKW
jgi:hypothetical protein